uniref:Uncharacterized protein n=1 Tax=Anguilla anguilla TaxID=7936 RepID=A0A0E9QF01_ANGAN
MNPSKKKNNTATDWCGVNQLLKKQSLLLWISGNSYILSR